MYINIKNFTFVLFNNNKDKHKHLISIPQMITTMQLPLTNYGIPSLNFEVGILTPREIETIQRTLLPDKNIATDLNISYYTVLSHFKNIRLKTGLQDKLQLAYYLGTKQGIIN